MKGKYALMLVCSFLLLCSGCAEDNKVVEDKAEHQPDFEKYIQSDMSEILKVNANCVFPTECQSGIGIKAELGDELLWDRKDNLAEIFLGSKVTEEETKDYGIQKEKCRLLVKNSAFQDGYIQTLYFDAETLEQL